MATVSHMEENQSEHDIKKATIEQLELFIKKYADGIVNYPNGKCRNIREDIEFADCALTSFGQDGYDKGAKIARYKYNIIFPVWRTIVFFTDVDVSDILARVRNPHMNRLTKGFMYLLNEVMQYAYKVYGFARFLNRVRETALKYGKALVKITDANIDIVSWYNIVAYDWYATDNRHVRKVERGVMLFPDAIEFFKDFEDGIVEMISEEIELLRKSEADKITFLEYWDYHLIDGEWKWGKVLFLDRREYHKIAWQDGHTLQSTGAHDLQLSDELYRGTSGITQKYNGEELDRDGYFELDFINPVHEFCRFAFGVPKLMEALQNTMDEISHLKRKGDFAAYKSIWLHQKSGEGQSADNVEMQLRQGVESGALITYGEGDDLKHMTIGQPMQWFFNDVEWLKNFAMEIVGVNQLTATEEKASKSATQANNEAVREQTTFNWFLEEQNIFLRELLPYYAKSLLRGLKKKGLIVLSGDPKRIAEIRKFMFINHWAENYKQIIRNFRKSTGERPWTSDIDKIYKSQEREINEQFGKNEFPINMAKFKDSVIDTLDVFFDWHVTKESLNIESEREAYQYLFKQAQNDPYINTRKLMEKFGGTIPGTYDPDLYLTDEEVAEKLQIQQQQALIAQQTEEAQIANQQAQQEQGEQVVDEDEVGQVVFDPQGNPV